MHDLKQFNLMKTAILLNEITVQLRRIKIVCNRFRNQSRVRLTNYKLVFL